MYIYIHMYIYIYINMYIRHIGIICRVSWVPLSIAIHDSVAKSQCEVEVTVRCAVGDVAAHSRHGHDEKPRRREWTVNGWLMVINGG